MRPSVPVRKTALLLGIAGGLLACAAGIGLATALLPEWRAGEPADRAQFRDRYRQLAARAGFVPASGEPRISLTTGVRRSYDVFQSRGEGVAAQLAARTAIRVAAVQDVRGPEDWPEGNLGVQFSLDGEPLWLSWWDRSLNPFVLPRPDEAIRRAERLAPLLLSSGESLGPRRLDYFAGTPRLLLPVAGSSPPQHLLVTTQP